MAINLGGMTIKCKCKDCEKRHPGCHDKCSDYLNAKAQHAKESHYVNEKNMEFIAPLNIYYHKSCGRYERKK